MVVLSYLDIMELTPPMGLKTIFCTCLCYHTWTELQHPSPTMGLEWALPPTPISMSAHTHSLYIILYILHMNPQVGTNGIISFGRPFYFWYSRNFPTPYPWIRETYVAAPFWHDADIRSRGDVIYTTPSKDDYRSLYGVIDKFLVRESVWKTFLTHSSLLFLEFSAQLFVYG